MQKKKLGGEQVTETFKTITIKHLYDEELSKFTGWGPMPG